MNRAAVVAHLLQGWERGFPRGQDAVLAALAGGYGRAVALRDWLYRRAILRTRRLGVPVVSIGNLTVGGTGKTPAVELAVHTLAELGHRPAVVSRGYRRRTRGLEVVADTASIRIDPEDAGDEPFLLARRLPGVPVVVGADRYAAGRLAIERFGTTAVVLDDGFQQRALAKDLEVVMVRARHPWGNGALLPRGPLRESLQALARAHVIVVAGAETEADVDEVRRVAAVHAPDTPVLAARYAAVECWQARDRAVRPLDGLRGARLLGFAGIAAPDAFARTLAELGVDAPRIAVFGDHHWYTADDLAELDARAKELAAAGLVTTEKDWVRLRHLPPPACPLWVVSVRLVLTSGHAAWRAAFERACPRR